MIHNICVSSEACVCPASHSNDYDCDCLAFALLSHGEDEGMIHGTDEVIAIDSLMAPLKHEPNMTHFAGKPKLVFVQVAVLFQHYVRIFCIYLSKNIFEDYLGEKQCQGMTVEKKSLWFNTEHWHQYSRCDSVRKTVVSSPVHTGNKVEFNTVDFLERRQSKPCCFGPVHTSNKVDLIGNAELATLSTATSCRIQHSRLHRQQSRPYRQRRVGDTVDCEKLSNSTQSIASATKSTVSATVDFVADL